MNRTIQVVFAISLDLHKGRDHSIGTDEDWGVISYEWNVISYERNVISYEWNTISML